MPQRNWCDAETSLHVLAPTQPMNTFWRLSHLEHHGHESLTVFIKHVRPSMPHHNSWMCC